MSFDFFKADKEAEARAAAEAAAAEAERVADDDAFIPRLAEPYRYVTLTSTEHYPEDERFAAKLVAGAAAIPAIIGLLLLAVHWALALIPLAIAAVIAYGGASFIREMKQGITTEYKVPLDSPAHTLWNGRLTPAGIDDYRILQAIREAAEATLDSDRQYLSDGIHVEKAYVSEKYVSTGDVEVVLQVPSALREDELRGTILEAANLLRITGISGFDRGAERVVFLFDSASPSHWLRAIQPEPEKPKNEAKNSTAKPTTRWSFTR